LPGWARQREQVVKKKRKRREIWSSFCILFDKKFLFLDSLKS
jgi:hypothetical protein